MERPTFKQRQPDYYSDSIKSIFYDIENFTTHVSLKRAPQDDSGAEDNAFQDGAFLLRKLTDIPTEAIRVDNETAWRISSSITDRDRSLRLEVSDREQSFVKAARPFKKSKKEITVIDDDWRVCLINDRPIDAQFSFRLPILPSMVLAYKYGYIAAKEDSKALLTTKFASFTGIAGDALFDEPQWADVNSASTWVAHAIAGCQAEINDRDPNNAPFYRFPAVLGITKFMFRSGTCIVFTVTCHEKWSTDQLSQYVVAHEVGHAGGLGHGPGLMANNDDDQTERFSPTDINQLRSKTSDW